MNLDNFESEIPSVILQRGQGYITAVSELEETEPEFWQAYVQGSEIYDVELQMDGNNIIDWSCSCPYDGGPVCKHVVASLLVMRQKKSAPTSQSASGKKRLTTREQLDQLLTSLPREQLETYIRQLLHDDRALLESFLLRYQTAPGGESPVRRYQKLLTALVHKHGGRHGYIEYRDAQHLENDVYELINTLDQSSLGAADKAEVVFALAHGLAGIANTIDDSDGTLGTLMYALCDTLRVVYPALEAAAQSALFQRMLDLQSDPLLDDFGLAETFLSPLRDWAASNETLQDTYLRFLDQRAATTKYDWMPAAYLRDKFHLLQQWGRVDEARMIAAANLKVFEFREMLVKEAIAAKNFDQALRLVREGMKADPRQENQWQQYIIDIARLKGDKATLRTELEQVFRSSGYRLAVYRELQATYTREEWKTQWHHYYQLIPANSSFSNFDRSRAVLLSHEKDYAALYALVSNLPAGPLRIEMLRNYGPLLVDHYPEEIPVWYSGMVCDVLAGGTGRKVYEQAIKDLRVLKKMPEGSGSQKPCHWLL